MTEYDRAKAVVKMAEANRRQGKAAFEFEGKVVDPPGNPIIRCLSENSSPF